MSSAVKGRASPDLDGVTGKRTLLYSCGHTKKLSAPPLQRRGVVLGEGGSLED